MKKNFKKAISYAAALIILILSPYTFSGLNKKSNNIMLPLATSDQTENTEEKEEEANNFNFIKSNENVRDFLYDGSLLLYGGTALIIISCAGIIITFIPRRRKKRKQRKQNSNKLTEK